MAIIYVTCCWFAGIWLATNGAVHEIYAWPLWLSGALGSGIAALGLRRQPGIALLALCLAAFLGGAARGALARPPAAGEMLPAGDVAAYNGGGSLQLSGWVAAEPRLSDSALTVRLAVETVTVGGESRPVAGTVLVRLPRFTAAHYGDRLLLRGRLETPPREGEFDYRAYLARQGIYSQMLWPVVEQVEAVQNAPVSHHIFGALFAVKGRAQATIEALFPGQEAALLSGILLGNDEGLSPGLLEAFRRTGTSHVIAISGFNIALLVGMLLALGRPFLGARRAAWVPLLGVATYTLLVGADSAVVRAAIMGSLYLFGGRLLGRPTFAPAGLFTAGLLMTLANPLLLASVGFQLSFAATLGLMVYVPPLTRRLRVRLDASPALPSAWRKHLLALPVELVLVTVVAQVVTLPIVLYHFGQLSLVSLPANFLVLPAQPAIMVAGGLALIAGLVVPAAALPLAWTAGLFLRYTTGVVRLLAGLPLAAIGVEMGPRSLFLFYLLLALLTWLLLQEKGRRRLQVLQTGRQARRAVPALSVLALILAWQWARSQPDGYLHVAFLDVGQGDAIFIQTPAGRQILVDGGHYPSRLNDRLGRYLPFWDRHLDLLVATHPDADHVSGLPDLFRRYRIDLLLTGPPVEANTESAYGALLATARAHRVPIRSLQAGEGIRLDGGVRLTCLHPGPDPAADGNENSLVLRLDYADFSLLLMGDAGEQGERALVDRRQPLQALVLKAGHHGARTSSNDFFLEATRPRLVVVSAGADNRFGHPHPETLARAAAAGAAVLRTDRLGTIHLVTDGQQMWWEAER